MAARIIVKSLRSFRQFTERANFIALYCIFSGNQPESFL